MTGALMDMLSSGGQVVVLVVFALFAWGYSWAKLREIEKRWEGLLDAARRDAATSPDPLTAALEALKSAQDTLRRVQEAVDSMRSSPDPNEHLRVPAPRPPGDHTDLRDAAQALPQAVEDAAPMTTNSAGGATSPVAVRF